MTARMALLTGLFIVGLLPGIAHAQQWREITPAEGAAPAPRRNATAVYDPVDHRVILFGGRADAGDLNDVWALDLAAGRWVELTPATGPAPAPRFTPSGVYDPGQRRLIVWSGQGAGFFNDVWAFDLGTNTWSEFAPPEPRPNVRYGAASVFDPVSGSLVTFAGFTDQGRFDDTWRFDVNAGAWTELSPAGSNPEERCLHTASYDALERRMIIYGGQRFGPLGDLWAFDLDAQTWAELTPSESPAARFFPASIYDARNHRFMIFGGNRGPGGLTNEVWSFDLSGGTWKAFEALGEAPGVREGATAVYVASEDRMIVFGGRGGALLNDVWALEGLSVSTAAAREAVPFSSFVLHPSYPNPVRGAATIAYELAVPARVVLTLYDVRGRAVRTLVDAPRPAGRYTVRWDGRDGLGQRVSPGLYLYKLQARDVVTTRSLVVLR